MFKRILTYAALLVCCGIAAPAWAQDPQCTFVDKSTIKTADVFFNYGSVTDAFSFRRRTSFSLGEPVVGPAISTKLASYEGFWSRFLIPPLAPFVTASQGELLDRIQISWALNPLGAQATDGFKVYRDGVFLALVDRKTFNFNDFNVIAGRPYNYEVRGVNSYGESAPGKALGFQVPNGVVTGWVQTINGSPVPDALITLMPMQGFSAKFGPMDGAFADTTDSGLTDLLPASGDPWSLSFWVKTSSATAHAGILQLQPFLLNIRNSAGGEGIEVDKGGAPFLSANFPAATKNDWHHVALSFDGATWRLYVDGTLSALASSGPIAEAQILNAGSRTGLSGTWEGRLDELRIYHRTLDELDLGEVMEGTASTLTEGLQFYWKMDEERGTKAFDLIHRTKLYFCGALFDKDRPPVRTAGLTNEQGYYRIESASYGTGTTFLAEPTKNFYMHRALKFNRAMSDYDTLPDFSLTKKATLELWVNSAGPDGTQCLLSKRWGAEDFQLLLRPNGTSSDVIFYLTGFEHNFGLLGMGYQHLAFTIDSSGANRTVTAYKNGVPFGTPHTFTGVTGNWSEPGKTWMVGARPNGAGQIDYYGGLIDEIALYDTTLSVAKILQHVQNSRDPQERGLRIYFPFDEGSGSRLNNLGSVLTTYGKTFGTEWSTFAPNQKTMPHVFTPQTRQVTLNPSITSVDQVDFTDRSTVAVSGFVRYAGTDCFAQNVEILVNGESFKPKIFTDSIGRFLIDLDPGDTKTLTPKFEDHVFTPAFWDVTNVTSPIAGILFTDITARTIEGKVAGGDCKLPIVRLKPAPNNADNIVCIVRVRSTNGCFNRTMTIDNEEGKFEFNNLPPIKLTVTIAEFSTPAIKTFFQVSGGSQVDLSSKARDTVNFIYYAPPKVEIFSGLDPVGLMCPTIVLNQGESKTVKIKVKEPYYGGDCYLDTADIRVINGFADTVVNVGMSKKELVYKFKAGAPNPSPPHLKTFSVIATTLTGNECDTTVQGVVTGVKSKANTFTTRMPEKPMLVLRDPPGDGSYAFVESEQKVCKTLTVTLESYDGIGGGIKFDNAPDLKVVAAPLGVGSIIETEAKFGGGISGTTTYKKVKDNSVEVCTSFHERFSTSEDELVVGDQGGDMFVGGGLNVEFGFADEVVFDVGMCKADVKEILAVAPKEFGTTFMYSEWNIKNNVIRYLDKLANNASIPVADRAKYLQSKVAWETILTNNVNQKKAAKFRKNISFDAGATYEYSETSDSTITKDTSAVYDSEGEIVGFYGGGVEGVGIEAELKIVFGSTTDTTKSTVNSNSLTTGYVLKDNDPGDAFSVDVAMDDVYHTPVFNTRVGQSSCPWEPKTAHREGNSLEMRDGSSALAIDVPSNEPAVFKFTLGNNSETNETRSYAFTSGPESNPHGAKIFLNGAPLDHPVMYAIPYGTSIPITVTLERGPEEYNYDSLEVVLYSVCEDDRANALGILPDDDSILYHAIFISAHFIKPCSEVDITVPEQNFVILNNDPLQPGTDRRITVSGYDRSSPDFQLVRVQYRRTDGDGAWINIPGTSEKYNPNWSGFAALPNPKPPTLGPDFTQFIWDTKGLDDGPYEIHAWAVCTGNVADKPGFSQIIKGRIDRQPPSLVGLPEPSDGVLQLGDEISFTFNKPVNCNKLIEATGLPTIVKNNVGLFDATTGKVIDVDISCYENKITLVPKFQNEFLENRNLRAELHNIQDLTGNTFDGTRPNNGIWEFFVDRNELAWLTDSVGLTKYEDQTKTVSAQVHNRGGSPVSFSITKAPSWVRVVPNKGTLVPNEIRPITFEVDSTLAFGRWSDSIVLHTETGQNAFFMGGDEALPIGARVVCRPPNWSFKPTLYENSMNMVLELNIQGQVSKDVEDIVVAYIGDELRGKAYLQYAPEVNKYLAYITIYGNLNDVMPTPKSLRFEIWDASACMRFGEVVESQTYQPDNIVGSSSNPQVLHTNSLVLREVPFGFGWNWLSFNLVFPDNSLTAALASPSLLKHPENDLMKSQTAFSIYDNGWFGSLTNLGNTSMYIYRADVPDTLKMLGTVLDPATTPIPLVANWNWIGYVPSYSLPINEALSSLPSQPGDLIKGQFAFAQYFNSTFGWVGNLKYMQPPNGYQIKVATAGTLLYPPPSHNRTSAATEDRGGDQFPAFWSVNPSQYEHSMTLIGMLKVNNANATTATMELGVFAGSEVRGSAKAIYVAPLNAYLFFLTSYANGGGEQLKFKLFDSSTGSVQDLTETMWFSADLHQGGIENPVPFTLKSSGAHEVSSVQSFDVQPNPFSTETMFRFMLPRAQEVRLIVTDMSGREVSRLGTEARAGLNTVSWNGMSDAGARLEAGVYFVRLQTDAGSVVKKVVVQH